MDIYEYKYTQSLHKKAVLFIDETEGTCLLDL